VMKKWVLIASAIVSIVIAVVWIFAIGKED
jgi:uncharacterized membrane protein YqiK